MKALPLTIIVVVMLCVCSKLEAGCKVDVSELVDWQIVYSGTVTGYINERGEEEDAFEGCEHGRVLIVDYSKTITCAEYNYSYAYMPDIVVMSNGSRYQACIDGEMYDIWR